MRQLFSKSNRYIFLRLIFKNYFFIIYSFINCLFPVLITIIVAYSKPDADYDPIHAIISIGTLTAFLIAFYQIGFIFSTGLLNALIQAKKDSSKLAQIDQKHIVCYQYIFAIVVGICLMLIYIFVSAVYTYIQIIGPNTTNIFKHSIEFILSSSPTIVLTLLNSIIVFNIFNKVGNFKATVIIVGQFIINMLFIAVVGLQHYHQLDIYAFSIGIFVGDLINLAISAIVSYYLLIHFSFENFKTDLKKFIKIFFKMMRISLVVLYGSLLKIIVIMILRFINDSEYDNVQNTNFLLSRLVFLIELYAVGFFISGIGYSLVYTKAKYKNHPEIFYSSYKTNWLLGVIGAVLVSLTAIIFRISVEPLMNLYMSNTNLDSILMIDGVNGIKWYVVLPNNWGYFCTAIGVILGAFSLPLGLNLKPKKISSNHFVNLINAIWNPSIKWLTILVIASGFAFVPAFKGFEAIAFGFLIGVIILLVIDIYRIMKMNSYLKYMYFKNTNQIDQFVFEMR